MMMHAVTDDEWKKTAVPRTAEDSPVGRFVYCITPLALNAAYPNASSRSGHGTPTWVQFAFPRPRADRDGRRARSRVVVPAARAGRRTDPLRTRCAKSDLSQVPRLI